MSKRRREGGGGQGGKGTSTRSATIKQKEKTGGGKELRKIMIAKGFRWRRPKGDWRREHSADDSRWDGQ